MLIPAIFQIEKKGFPVSRNQTADNKLAWEKLNEIKKSFFFLKYAAYLSIKSFWVAH